ncbi:uncharacterized protein LOC108625150 [Ceratina calcarata]|uniref:Uncharacterized protein LOC108625150 n=1 Tax=Ceratina calcarata TaxID=156304 RepID=A0AAJ7S107_9HYME|nr:uncharacterized protein LOC108625150 [Ceratina calcarata]XP_026669451.1 uncharacterized protein LOC108625150 [Ceratina calcarata]
MVKKRGIVWNYYNKKILGSQVIAFCKFCNQSYIQNATRMERHMGRCSKCPEDVKQQFIQVAHSKKHKSDSTDNKLNDRWPKQESPVDSSITDTKLEDFYEWNYKSQSYLADTVQQQINFIKHNNTQNWTSQNNVTKSNDTHTKCTSRNWENQNDTGTIASAGIQEQTSSVQQTKSYSPKEIFQWPVSAQTYEPSSLRNKIYQEQLLEKCALRRAAELDVQRKMLELERFQWEYERDKLQTEVRWAHETRMMQFKEERERQLTEQSRIRTPSSII